jgi:dTMP kinase
MSQEEISAPTPVSRGRFVTFEGGEGAGKTTQLARLAERLRERGVETIATREPGGSPRAERLREALLLGRAAALGPLGEAVLFSAARIDHVDTLIEPALRRGAFVLSDRFADSTRAYQGALGKADPRLLALLEHIAVGAARPDLTIILDLPAQEGLDRAALRREAGATADRFEREDASFHAGLRRAFLDIAAAAPDRCCVVNASQPADEIAQAIWQLVEARFLGRRQSEAAPTEAAT